MQVHNFTDEETGSTEIGRLAYDPVERKVHIQDLIKAYPFHYTKLPTKYQEF